MTNAGLTSPTMPLHLTAANGFRSAVWHGAIIFLRSTFLPGGGR